MAEKPRRRRATKTELPARESTGLRRELDVHREELRAQNEELRAANAELMDVKERYAQLYDAAPVGYFTLDEQGMIVQANVAGSEMLEASRKLLSGRCFDELVVPSSRESFRKFRARVMAHGGRPVHETALGTSGRQFPVHIEAARLTGLAFPAPQCLLCVSDETERRNVEDERRQLEARVAEALRIESLGMMAGAIAHDFNNILAVALAHTDLLLLEKNQSARNQASVHEIRSATTRAAGLSQQMLAYSGRGRLQSEPLDISEVVRAMSGLLKAASPKDVSLTFDLADDLPPVNGDSVQIQQIVLNLVVNAGEAIAPHAGKIVLRTKNDSSKSGSSEPEGNVLIEVTDDGKGMDATTCRRAFDPFFSTKFTGRGLGLAVVHGNVRAHGGTVTVDSRLHRGTRFRVHLPAMRDPVVATFANTRAAAVREWRGSGLVLVVDDDAGVRGAMGDVLERIGFTVCFASDGLEALDITRRSIGALVAVLVDLTMAPLDGRTTLAELKRLAPALPVVLMSGYSSEALDDDLVSTASGFVSKPFTMASVVIAMQRAVEHPAGGSAA